MWYAFLDRFDQQGRLDWDEVFVDGSFAPAKKGASMLGSTCLEREPSGWWLLMAKEYLWHVRPQARPQRKSNSSKGCEVPRPEDRSIPLIADRAYDSDPLRERLKQSKWDLICPRRNIRRPAPTQDGRKLRRYRRRLTIEQTFAWQGNYRRLLVRAEFYVILYDAFLHIACAMVCIRKFCKRF